MVKESKEETKSLLHSHNPAINSTESGYQSFDYQFPPSENSETSFIQPENEVNGTSTAAAIFIVVNAAMGAGLLNFPNAFGEAGGIGHGVVLEMVFLVFILISLFALAHCSQTHCSTTYQGAIESTCGRGFGTATEICIIVYMFGTSIAMVIIIGDQFDKVMEAIVGVDFCHNWYMNRMFTMSAFSILIILPLCIPKDIGFLKHASIIGVLGTLIVMITVVVKYFTTEPHPTHKPRGKNEWTITFSAIPAIFFAYQCHVSSVPVYASLKRKTMTNWSIVIICSMTLCCLSYTVTGIFGYLTFGDAAQSDILESYDAKDWFVIVARIAIVVAMITTYPILQFCGRAALITLFVKMGLFSDIPTHKTEKIRRYCVTLCWFFPSLVLSLLIPNIGEAIAVVGGIAGCFILVFPGFALVRLVYDMPEQKTWKSYALIAIGLIFFIGGIFLFGEITTRAILSDISGSTGQPSSTCYAT